jgi:hypothetical protein
MPTVHPPDDINMEPWWNDTDRGKLKSSEKNLSATTDITWTDQEANPGLRGERLATNRLSHVMVCHPT